MLLLDEAALCETAGGTPPCPLILKRRYNENVEIN